MKKKLLVALTLLTLGTQVQAGKTGSFLGGWALGNFTATAFQPRQAQVVVVDGNNDYAYKKGLRDANKEIKSLTRDLNDSEQEREEVRNELKESKVEIKELKAENRKLKRSAS